MQGVAPPKWQHNVCTHLEKSFQTNYFHHPGIARVFNYKLIYPSKMNSLMLGVVLSFFL